jgi:hypothetical protein
MSNPLQKLLDESDRPLPREAVGLLLDIERRSVRLSGCEFHIPEDAWNTEPAGAFVVHVVTRQDPIEVPWSEKLNGEFLRLGIRVVSPQQEAFRFGTHLLSNLRYPDIRFGKDFTNSVLWDVVSVRFGSVPEVHRTLKRIPHHSAHQSTEYGECHHYLESCLSGLGNALVVQLHYENRGSAYSILAAAALFVLDRRYSLSLRDSLFGR